MEFGTTARDTGTVKPLMRINPQQQINLLQDMAAFVRVGLPPFMRCRRCTMWPRGASARA